MDKQSSSGGVAGLVIEVHVIGIMLTKSGTCT